MREKGPAIVTTSASNLTRFGYASHLFCRECGATFELGASHAFAVCFAPLQGGSALESLPGARDRGF